MNFWNGFICGVVTMNVMVSAIIWVAWRLQQPKLRRVEELRRQAQVLAEAGMKDVTWSSEEQREAWLAAKEQWEKDVDRLFGK